MFWTSERIYLLISSVVVFLSMIGAMIAYGWYQKQRRMLRRLAARQRRQSLKSAGTLRNLRIQHGYSLTYAASKMEVSQAALSKWENLKSAPRMYNIVRIARFYNITPLDVKKMVRS